MKVDARFELVAGGIWFTAGLDSIRDGNVEWGVLIALTSGLFIVNNWRLMDGHLPLGKAAVRWLARRMGVGA